MKIKGATREKLLSSASKEFARHGYVKANVDAISTNAGFGKGTVYNYYKSKLDLFVAVVEKNSNELVDEINENIKDIRDPVEKLKKSIETDFQTFQKNSDLWITIIKEAYTADREKREDFYNASLPVFNIYYQLIEEGIKTGCYKKDTDTFVTVNMILGIIESLATMNNLINESRIPPEELVKRIFDTILYGIKK